jgi:nucleoside recognition membrane protein YjiH
MNSTPTSKHRFLTFTLRDILWATVVVALIVMLVLSRYEVRWKQAEIATLENQQQESKEQVRQLMRYSFQQSEEIHSLKAAKLSEEQRADLRD